MRGACGAAKENEMNAVQQEFSRLYNEWMEAVRRRDFPSLERVLADEYVYTATGQGRVERQGWLKMVTVYDLQTFEFQRLDLRLYGDVALVLCDYRQTGAVGGEARSGNFFITDTWVRRDGRWQIAARSSILT
jgi:ketosteroid isomerase-like protein